jgi:hypothetical protein
MKILFKNHYVGFLALMPRAICSEQRFFGHGFSKICSRRLLLPA